MTLRFLLLTVLSVMIVLPTFVARAQEEEDDPRNPSKGRSRILVGPVAGINRSLHSGGFASISGDAACPTFESGTENGYYLGFSAEYLLGDAKNANSSIIARVLYDYLPAFFSVPGDDYPSRLVLTDQVVNSQVTHVTEVRYTLLNIDLMYRINPIPDVMLGFAIGPQIGIPIGANQEQRFELKFDPNRPVQFANDVVPGTLNLIDDPTAPLPRVGEFTPRYTDESRTSIVLYDGDIIAKQAFRFGIKMGLQYEVLMGKFLFVPHAFYNWGLTEINSRDPWSVSAFQFGADLRFAL